MQKKAQTWANGAHRNYGKENSAWYTAYTPHPRYHSHKTSLKKKKIPKRLVHKCVSHFGCNYKQNYTPYSFFEKNVLGKIFSWWLQWTFIWTVYHPFSLPLVRAPDFPQRNYPAPFSGQECKWHWIGLPHSSNISVIHPKIIVIGS